jgi:hypothetical protein
VAAH